MCIVVVPADADSLRPGAAADISSLCPSDWAYDSVPRFGAVASRTETFSVFFDARILASYFESHAVAVMPSGETVTTKYGIPDFGGW